MSVWQRDLTNRLYRVELEQFFVDLPYSYLEPFDNLIIMADYDEVNQGENEHNNAIPVRTLRDYLQPTKASTPSCIVFPNVVGNFEMKPGVIQLLPKFHGLDYENPHLHLKEFDKVCATTHRVPQSLKTVKSKLLWILRKIENNEVKTVMDAHRA